MKAFLILLAAGLAASRFSAYEPNTEYVYKYRSQTVSGVPHHSIEAAGVKIEADLRLQMKSDRRATLKLENVRLFKVLTAVTHYWPESGFLPDSSLSQVDSETAHKMTIQLEKPVKFSYYEGDVEEPRMDPTEPLWSINIKKGLLSLLKVTPKCQQEQDGYDRESLEEDWKSNNRYRDDESEWNSRDSNHGTVCKVMEADVTGVCETDYAVIKDQRFGDQMNVTKTKNFDKCDKSLQYEQGPLSGLTIDTETIETSDVIQKSSHCDYELKGTPSSFIIWNVRQDSRYIVTPLTLEDGSAVTHVIQTLEHRETKSVSNVIQSETTLETREMGLLYEFPNNPFSKSMDLSMEWENRDNSIEEDSWDSEDNMKKIDGLLNEVMQEVKPLTQDAVRKIKQIAGLMRTLSTAELKNLCTKHTVRSGRSGTPVPTQKGEIVLDLLPTLTTPNSMKVTAELIKNSEISETRAILSLKLLSMTLTPNIDILDVIMPGSEKLWNCQRVQKSKTLRHTVFITLPTIASRLEKHAKNVAISSRRITPVINRFMEALISTYESMARSEEDKVAMIKGMANLANPGLVDKLAEIVQDKSQQLRVRGNAAMALSKMPRSCRGRVEAILGSVYMDLTDKPMIRQECFVNMMDVKPKSGKLNLIVRTQRKEKSPEVGATVSSYLFTLAYCEMPGYRELARNIRHILPLVKVFSNGDIRRSKAVHYDTFFKNIAVGTKTHWLTEQDQMFPSLIVSKMMLNALGKTFNPVETHISYGGVGGVLNKAFGVHSKLRESFDSKELKDILKIVLTPLKAGRVDLGKVKQEVMDIIEKLGIKNRDDFEHPYLGIDVQLLTKEMLFIDLNANDILEWIESGRLPIFGNVKQLIEMITGNGKTFDIVKVLNLPTSTLQVPSASGMPISLNHTWCSVLQATGDFSMRLENGGSVELYVNPTMKYNWQATLGCDCGLIKSGISLRGNGGMKMPVTVNGRYSRENQMLKISAQMPNEEVKVLSKVVTPVVFFKTLSGDRQNSVREEGHLDLTHPARMEQVETRIPVDIPSLNTRMEQRHSVAISKPNWMPVEYMWGPCSSNVTMKPLRSSKPVVFTATYSSANGKEQVRQKLGSRLNRMFESDDGSSSMMGFETKLSFGPQDSEDHFKMDVRGASMGETVLKSKWQLMTTIECPSMMRESIQVDCATNMRGFNPRELESMSHDQMVSQINMRYGSQSWKFIMFPSEPMAWNPRTENSFYSLLKYITGNRVEAEVVRTVSQKTPSLNFRYHVENNMQTPRETVTYTMIASAVAAYIELYMPLIPTSNIRQINNAPSQPTGQIKIVPEFQKMMITMRLPSGYEYDLNVPAYLYEPVSSLISLEFPHCSNRDMPDTYPSGWKRQHRYNTGKCSLRHYKSAQKDMIETTDLMHYSLADYPSSCKVLLAKDCTRHSLFTVIMNKNEGKKSLRLLVPGHEIDLKQSSGWLSSSDVKLYVDGEEREISEFNKVKLEDGSRVYAEAQKEQSWTSVQAYGIKVSTNGEDVVLEIDPSHRRTLCGLCGNYNGHWADEYQGPDMYSHTSAERMISKYMIPSGQCDVQTIHSLFGLTVVSPKSCTAKEKTVFQSIKVGNVDKTCFSIQPLKECPRNCRSQQTPTPTRSVEVFCKNTHNPTTKEYIKIASNGGIVHTISGKKPNHPNMNFQAPTSCKPE